MGYGGFSLDVYSRALCAAKGPGKPERNVRRIDHETTLSWYFNRARSSQTYYNNIAL